MTITWHPVAPKLSRPAGRHVLARATFPDGTVVETYRDEAPMGARAYGWRVVSRGSRATRRDVGRGSQQSGGAARDSAARHLRHLWT